ncbi:hypothetical protein CEUSTIGMA_g378.t1 [Chlamydomonas eustigma]|uniref:Uncharacterized protein n=1 Tax=Chlamydomonas eustigma TaxID=1157962 RepID=A0A250WQ25_9CHLO|nr:hypothetical protein CEUSTIGMA_g378.t1 [Chlamydomonas eustigma]|eukprot:GAX72923.1 hypothetical protein CEUSTIGMA_g378.t1 [Chlamydomonas eustigma]
MTSSAAAPRSVNSPESQYAADTHAQSTVFAALLQMTEMMARSQRAQALQGQATSLLARQVISCLQGIETQELSKSVQEVRESADWIQQIHQLNTELKVQRYSWQQVHNQLMETQAAVQVKEEELLVMGKDLFMARAEASSLRQQLELSRAQGVRYVMDAKDQELKQLQEAVTCQEEQSALLIHKGVEAAGGSGLDSKDVAEIEARLRTRLGSSSECGEDPATQSDMGATIVFRSTAGEEQIWRDKFMKKMAHIIASELQNKDSEINGLKEHLRHTTSQSVARQDPVCTPNSHLGAQGSLLNEKPSASQYLGETTSPLHGDQRLHPHDSPGMWRSDDDTPSSVVQSSSGKRVKSQGGAATSPGPPMPADGAAAATGSQEAASRHAAREQQWRRQLVRKLEALRQKLRVAAATADSTFEAIPQVTMPGGDLSEDSLWRSQGMAWVASCVKEASATSEKLMKSAEQQLCLATPAAEVGGVEKDCTQLQMNLDAARQQLMLLQASLDDARQRYAASEKKAEEAVETCLAAEKKLRDSEEARQRESVLAKQRTLLSEKGIRAAEARTLQAEQALQAAEARTLQAEQALQAAEARTLQAEQALQAAEARTLQAEQALQAAEAGATNAEQRLQVQEQETQRLESEIRSMAQNSDSVNTSYTLSSTLSARQTEEKVAELIRMNEELRTNLSLLTQELESGQKSLVDMKVQWEASQSNEQQLNVNRAHLELQAHNASAAAELAKSGQADTFAEMTRRLGQAEARLASECDLSESLGQVVEKLQSRLAALQQENCSLKGEVIMLAERAAMSEEAGEDARLMAEAASEASQQQIRGLERELEVAKQQAKEYQAETRQAVASETRQRVASRSARHSSAGGDVEDSSKSCYYPSAPTGEGIKEAPLHGWEARHDASVAVMAPDSLLEARARICALEQELSVLQARLSELLEAGKVACDKAIQGTDGSSTIAAQRSLQALLAVLQSIEVLHIKGTQQGSGLARIRVLQAELEAGLQNVLIGQGTGLSGSSLVQELRSLRIGFQQWSCTPQAEAGVRIEPAIETSQTKAGPPSMAVTFGDANAGMVLIEEERTTGHEHFVRAVEGGCCQVSKSVSYGNSHDSGDVALTSQQSSEWFLDPGSMELVPHHLEESRWEVSSVGNAMEQGRALGAGSTRDTPSCDDEHGQRGSSRHRFGSVGGEQGRLSGAGSRLGDDILEGIDAWELPPLPPPPCFD